MSLLSRISYTLTLVSLLGLLLNYSVLTLIVQFNPVYWVVYCLPLLLFLPFIYSRKLRSYQWLGFVILVYIIASVLTIFAPGLFAYGLISVFLCVLLFLSAIVFVYLSKEPKP